MSDQVKHNNKYNKRLRSVDDNLDPFSIADVSAKVVFYDGTTEMVIPVPLTLSEVSAGLYYVEFTVDPSLFFVNKTYHVIIEGQSFDLPKTTELVTSSFVVIPDRPEFTVDFG